MGHFMLGVGILAAFGCLWYFVGREGADELDGHNIWLAMVVGLSAWLLAEILYALFRR